MVLGVLIGWKVDHFLIVKNKVTPLKTEITALKTENQNVSIPNDETSKSIITARAMLQSKFNTTTPFRDRSAMDIGKILNFIVSNHCNSAPPHTGQKDINELFVVCRTACGGYAYVLRGLFAAYGIKTRYANLYNLPAQGNHTMIEAEISSGKWALFDPTFGSFFTSDGRIDGPLLSLEEVRFNLTPASIHQHVITAKKGMPIFDDVNLISLYDKAKFKYPNMRVENYLIAEIAAPAGMDLLVPLTLPLKIVNRRAIAGVINVRNIQEGQAGFLDWSNSTLNNDDPSDDTSYLFNISGNYDPYFRSMNILSLTGLKVGKIYDLNISGVIGDKDVEIQVVDIGRNLIFNTILPERLKMKTPFSLHRKFRASSKNGQIIINVTKPQNSKAYIFGVEAIEEKMK